MTGSKHLKGPLPEITVTDLDTASRILRHPGLMHELKWVVSIGSLAGPPDGWRAVSPKRKLRLVFDDVSRPVLQCHPPNDRHVHELLKFARKATEGPMLIHCAQGQSRSSAAALIVLASRIGEGREDEAVRKLHALIAEASGKLLRPVAHDIHPNRLMVWIGDRLLGREGRLWSALKATMGPYYDQGFDPRMTGY